MMVRMRFTSRYRNGLKRCATNVSNGMAVKNCQRSNMKRHQPTRMMCRFDDMIIYPCPACGQLLLMEFRPNNGPFRKMWCGAGPCESQAANNGATGLNRLSAYRKIVEAVAKEEQEKC